MLLGANNALHTYSLSVSFCSKCQRATLLRPGRVTAFQKTFIFRLVLAAGLLPNLNTLLESELECGYVKLDEI